MKELVFNISESFYSSLGEKQKGILSEKVQLLLDSLANEHVIARGTCNCNDCQPCSCDATTPCACNSTSFCRCDNTTSCGCDKCIPTPCGCDKTN